jgi:sulfoacetaldehyde acetyltransferase
MAAASMLKSSNGLRRFAMASNGAATAARQRWHFSSSKTSTMKTEEAFVKVLQMRGIRNAFGNVRLGLFPEAGVKFQDCTHECNAGITNGYSRNFGSMSMMVLENGPGITNLVTLVEKAYSNQKPLLLVTPQAASKTNGQDASQEVEQMETCKDFVCYQEEVRDPNEIFEALNRVIGKAFRESAPAQICIAQDMWSKVIDPPSPASTSV